MRAWAPSTTPAYQGHVGAGVVAAARNTDGCGPRRSRSGPGRIDRSLVISPPPAPDPLRPHKELLTAWLLLLLDRTASYGYELRREFAAHGLTVDSSALYRALRKLESEGLVASAWSESATGPRRRLYRLTAGGRRSLDEMATLIRDIRDVNDSFVRAHESVVRERAG